MSTYDLSNAQKLLDQFATQRVPMIGYCQARLIEISQQRCEVMIPLSASTKNHLDCMYFGALSVGADITGGFLAMTAIEHTQQPIELLFKDFHADFLLRANGDTHFICQDGDLIQSMIQQTLDSGSRVNQTLSISAVVPTLSDQPVAQFKLTLSLKNKPSNPI